MAKLVCKSHNVSLSLYHFVFAVKYRRIAIEEDVDNQLEDVCIEISRRYEIKLPDEAWVQKIYKKHHNILNVGRNG